MLDRRRGEPDTNIAIQGTKKTWIYIKLIKWPTVHGFADKKNENETNKYIYIYIYIYISIYRYIIKIKKNEHSF